MDKFVFDSGHDYEYAFYINDQLIIATNDDNFGLDCVFAAQIISLTSLDKGTQPFVVCDG